MPFETIAITTDGWTPLLTDRGMVVIETEAEWQALWDRMCGGQIPKPDLPEVDFTKSMVIGAFLGQCGTGGHALTIDAINDDGMTLNVLATQSSPGHNCLVSMALTAPYHVVKLAKISRPLNAKIDRVTRVCD